MFLEFRPIAKRSHRVTIKRLRQMCGRANFLEELVLFWCGANRRLVVKRNDRNTIPALSVAFVQKDKVVATAHLAATELLEASPSFEPLDETILAFNDQEGYRPNDEWFVARSNRLGIQFLSEHEINFAPAEAVSELMLSYVLSSLGYAEVDAVKSAEDPMKTIGYKLSLVFLGGVNHTGWAEYVGVLKGELVEFINRRIPQAALQFH